jgi:hypothetical protein
MCKMIKLTNSNILLKSYLRSGRLSLDMEHQHQEQQQQLQQTQRKYYSCHRRCGQEIYFDASNKNQSNE